MTAPTRSGLIRLKPVLTQVPDTKDGNGATSTWSWPGSDGAEPHSTGQPPLVELGRSATSLEDWAGGTARSG